MDSRKRKLASSTEENNGKNKKFRKDNRAKFFKDLNDLKLYTNEDEHYRKVKAIKGPLELDW